MILLFFSYFYFKLGRFQELIFYNFLLAATMLKFFSRYGEVIDCVVMKNPSTGKSRGFGFVKFRDPSCVEMVLSSGPHTLDGRQVGMPFSRIKCNTLVLIAN